MIMMRKVRRQGHVSTWYGGTGINRCLDNALVGGFIEKTMDEVINWKGEKQ